MEQSQVQHLLQRYADGLCTPDEATTVEHWYDALGTERAEPQLSAQDQVALEASMWMHIGQQMQPVAVSTKIPVHKLLPRSQAANWWRWAVAAVMVLGCGLGVLLFRAGPLRRPATVAAISAGPVEAPADTLSEWIEQTNATQQVAKISLQDGSVVTLSPASFLRYPRRFRGVQRRVELRGEAFFNVTHNPARPFQVYTDKLVTTVLGTSFWIKAYAGQAQAQVQVRTGRVRVTPLAGKGGVAPLPAPVIVLPNQQVAYSPQLRTLKQSLVAEPRVVATQAEEQVFDDRPVAEVLAALEKAYGVTLVFDQAAVANCTISFRFRDEPLFDKLTVLCKALGGSYQVVGTQIRIHTRGCQKS